MAEHYTKNTVSATAWCRKCQKMTSHRVDSGSLSACEECTKRLDREHDEAKKKVPEVERQFGLFERTVER